MGHAMQQKYEQAQDKQGNKLAQSKGRSNRKWSRWRQGCVIEALSLARSMSPFGEGVEAQCSLNAQTGHRILPMPSRNARCRESTKGPLRAVIELVQLATLGGGHRTLTNARRNLHNLIGGSRSDPKLYTMMIELRNNTKPLGAKDPKRYKL